MTASFPAESYDAGFLQLRSGLTIYPSQDKAIDKTLQGLVDKIPAQFVLLADISGQIISVKGDRSRVSEPVSLASLVAGDLAASREIARLLGEYQAYQLILREGKEGHTFIAEAGDYMVLLAQVSADIPLGWARMLIAKGAKDLAAIVEALPEELKEQDAPPPETLDIADDMTDMFGDALDSLWHGEQE